MTVLRRENVLSDSYVNELIKATGMLTEMQRLVSFLIVKAGGKIELTQSEISEILYSKPPKLCFTPSALTGNVTITNYHLYKEEVNDEE